MSVKQNLKKLGYSKKWLEYGILSRSFLEVQVQDY